MEMQPPPTALKLAYAALFKDDENARRDFRWIICWYVRRWEDWQITQPSAEKHRQELRDDYLARAKSELKADPIEILARGMACYRWHQICMHVEDQARKYIEPQLSGWGTFGPTDEDIVDFARTMSKAWIPSACVCHIRHLQPIMKSKCLL